MKLLTIKIRIADDILYSDIKKAIGSPAYILNHKATFITEPTIELSKVLARSSKWIDIE